MITPTVIVCIGMWTVNLAPNDGCLDHDTTLLLGKRLRSKFWGPGSNVGHWRCWSVFEVLVFFLFWASR